MGVFPRGRKQAPTADAGDDQSVAAGVEVTLDGSASSDQDGTIASYAWTQLLGDTVSLSSASASQPTFDAPETNAAQTLRFRLTVTDNDGDTDTDTVDVDVAAMSITPNVAPSADAGPNQTVAAGASVTLDGSGSFDSDGTIASYAWTQTAGDNVTLSSTSAQFPTFTAPSEAAAQFLRFRLTTTDNDGATDTDNVRIDVQAAGPPPLVAARRKDAANIKPVWLVELDADQLGGTPTTLRWASRDITLGVDAYDGDVLVEADPVAIRFGNLRARGGQAFPGTATVRAANTERLQATLAASYDLENDPCRVYLYFDGTTGADDDNKYLLFSGVIDDYESTEDLLTLSIVDDAFRLIRSFPTERLTPATYPFAPLDDYGEPVPLVLGRMAQAGPYDGSGDRFSLAPCRCVDKFTAEFLPASNIHTAGAVYQAYRSGQRQHVARIPTADIDEQSGNTFKVVGASRLLRRPPMRAETDNEITNWQRVADWRDATSAVMAANDLLSLYMGGSARLGTLTGLTLYLDFTGTVSARTTIDGTQDLSATTLTTPTNGAIRTADLSVSEWADSWGFERINVRVSSSGTSTIRRVWIEAEFDHDGIDDIEQWAISRAISGLADTDVLASGAVLENPADVIEGVLRHIGIPDSRINAPSVAAAKIARDGWRYGASIDRVRRPDFVSEMCAQAGYDLFTDHQGRLSLSAQVVAGDPAGVFLQDRHLIFDEQRQGHDIRINATPMGDLLNEGVVQYAFDPIANRYAGIAVQSGAYRTMQASANGEVATKAGGGFEFTDSTVVSFISSGAQSGDFLWTSGGSGQLLRVNSVAAAALGVEAARGVGVIIEDGIDSWYLGPNLNAAVLRSQLRYKLSRDYGGERGDFTDSAGYQASMIADDFTANALANHLVRWHADRLYQVQIETDWSGCDLQLGDEVVFDSDWLPAAKRPRLIDATVSCTFTAAEVTFSTQASLAALLYPETDNGDLMLIGERGVQADRRFERQLHGGACGIRYRNLPHWYAHAGGQTHSAAMADYGGGGIHPRPDACLALAIVREARRPTALFPVMERQQPAGLRGCHSRRTTDIRHYIQPRWRAGQLRL